MQQAFTVSKNRKRSRFLSALINRAKLAPKEEEPPQIVWVLLSARGI